MATSEKQAAANRENAKRSTGPRTEEGKAVSRGNAVKHGFCAEIVLLPEEDPDEFEAERRSWVAELAPRGKAAKRLAERAFADYVRLTRAERAENAAMLENVANADRDWLRARDEERRKALASFNEQPIASLLVLRSTPDGCRSLAALWSAVADRAAAGEALDVDGAPRVVDLLALDFRLQREFERLLAADGDGSSRRGDPSPTGSTSSRDRSIRAFALARAGDHLLLAEEVAPDFEERRRLAPDLALVDISPAGRTRRRYAASAERSMNQRIREARQAAASPEALAERAGSPVGRSPVAYAGDVPPQGEAAPPPASSRSIPSDSYASESPVRVRNEPISPRSPTFVDGLIDEPRSERLPISIAPGPPPRPVSS
ncbi:MAG: hypothetical protein SFX72_11135 [Isosphaeraceae bacterium]|nr:hypothetical protein [Isosphaeraceae bacterium]